MKHAEVVIARRAVEEEYYFSGKGSEYLSALQSMWQWARIYPPLYPGLHQVQNYLELTGTQGSIQQPIRLVKWKNPPSGTVALNTYGSVGILVNNMSGFGGLLRNDDGHWLLGFFGSLGEEDILFAKLFAIWKGLTICWNQHLSAVQCWSDSQLAVSLIHQNSCKFHHHSALISAIQELINREWSVSVQHLIREGNSSVDFLAKLGLDFPDYFVQLQDPPVGILPLQ
ncbi:Ribonuclease H-like superfamily [Sesbania bispinosa]|nr:Ribonuclease H-like superfamily [Sesbania bispinosa]